MRKWFKRLLLAATAAAAVLALAAWGLLRGSMPALDGEQALPGLSAPVSIQRDALGVVTIEAGSEADALRALGYVHAQERYFEMDLMRRTSAGELSELFGAVALEVDKRHRVHRMRARVDAHLDAIAGDRLPQLQAYADGVNAGLSALRVRPWPYLLLRQRPRPWLATDSALAGFAMYFDLQDATNARELTLWRLQPHLPPDVFDLLTHPGSRWDAPLLGEGFGDAPLPTAAQVDLRALPAPPGDEIATLAPKGTPGSNNFAVSGALTADGRAIVADDMHLGLRAPNLWFRARLRWPDADAPGGQVDVQGVTLPGLPAVVVGSNGHVAWGYTNSYGDYLDWALENPCAGSRPVVEAPETLCAAVETHLEPIFVAGAEPVAFEVQETRWGPILHQRSDDQALSLRWTAHLPGSINLGLMGFATAGDLDAALAIADRTAIPTQNLALADSGGRIAWRLMGPLPERRGSCSSRDLVANAPDPATNPPDMVEAAAQARREPCHRWSISTSTAPSIRSPQADRLWTANARVVSGEALERVGDGGYAFGARAAQIRDSLGAKQRFGERDLLAIQLDDRAVLMTQWRDLLHALPTDAGTPALRELIDATGEWTGRASVDSAGYRLVRAWRLAVHARLLDGLLAPARAALGDDFATPDLPQFEGVAWPLVRQRPPHLLSRRYASWQALFEDAAREVRDDLSPSGPLRERTWGERNTAAICHPLAGAIPLGKRLLCMPAEPLPGDAMMPRVQGPSFGASQRMVVSPGREADGILHMPGGQSGHPLSPFWGAGHDDWVRGRPSPFLPGPPVHRLTLHP